MQPSAPPDRALVVYESMFGNTRMIAEAIGDGLREHFAQVDVISAPSAPSDLSDVAVVIVGAPTHVLGLPRPKTRDAARRDGADEAPERGVREWLDAVRPPDHPVVGAAFDTRLRSWFAGSARRPIARRLRRRGFRLEPGRSFTVTAGHGPLADGELEGARRWAASFEPVTVEVTTP